MKKNHQFRPDFWIVPIGLTDHPKTEPFDEKVYAAIYWFEHLKDGECRASNNTIAEVIKPHDPQPRSVQNSLNRLEECGFIERDYKDSAKRNRLRIRTLVAYKYVRNGSDRQPASETAMTDERNHDDRHERNGHDQSIEYKNSNIKESKKFNPPSLEEVTTYCTERTNQIDPQGFIDFYSSKGWMIGKNKMKDWRAAIRTWENRNKPQKTEVSNKYIGL